MFLLTVFNILYFYKSRDVPESVKLKDEKKERISWEDADLIRFDKTRIGPGEHGIGVIITDPEEIKLNEEWMEKEGFYAGVSDKISLTRALPDQRAEM